MLEDGWLPQGHGPVLASVEYAAPRQGPSSDMTTLGLDDGVVFFITLNPISACCNLSNDSSLLAIAEFKGFFILPHPVDPLGWH